MREGNLTMMYLLAIVFPPLALLLMKKPFSAILNCVLLTCFWIPGIIHALIVVHMAYKDKRVEKIIGAIVKRGK